MRLWNSLLTKLRVRRAQPEITQRQAQQIRPLRNPRLEWEHNDDGYVVATLTRRASLRGKLISFFLAVPETRPVVLDEVGTFVWNLCDGEHSVEQITEALCAEYKLSRREVVMHDLRSIAGRGVVSIEVLEITQFSIRSHSVLFSITLLKCKTPLFCCT